MFGFISNSNIVVMLLCGAAATYKYGDFKYGAQKYAGTLPVWFSGFKVSSDESISAHTPDRGSTPTLQAGTMTVTAADDRLTPVLRLKHM
jgi:hypothetical protein